MRHPATPQQEADRGAGETNRATSLVPSGTGLPDPGPPPGTVLPQPSATPHPPNEGGHDMSGGRATPTPRSPDTTPRPPRRTLDHSDDEDDTMDGNAGWGSLTPRPEEIQEPQQVSSSHRGHLHTMTLSPSAAMQPKTTSPVYVSPSTTLLVKSSGNWCRS